MGCCLNAGAKWMAVFLPWRRYQDPTRKALKTVQVQVPSKGELKWVLASLWYQWTFQKGHKNGFYPTAVPKWERHSSHRWEPRAVYSSRKTSSDPTEEDHGSDANFLLRQRSFKSTVGPAPAHAHAHAHCLPSGVSLHEPTTSVWGNPNHRGGPCRCPSCPRQATARVEPEWISLKLSQPRLPFFHQRLHAGRGDEPSSESTSPPRLRNRQPVSDGSLLFQATNTVTSGSTEEETWCNRFYVLKW